MRFSEFLQMDEIFGPVGGPSGHRDLIKMSRPVKNKGSSVSRMFNAGKVKNPARPARVNLSGPLTKPTLLK